MFGKEPKEESNIDVKVKMEQTEMEQTAFGAAADAIANPAVKTELADAEMKPECKPDPASSLTPAAAAAGGSTPNASRKSTTPQSSPARKITNVSARATLLSKMR
jgi:hypothetical protein